jgi:hypothetical protein
MHHGASRSGYKHLVRALDFHHQITRCIFCLQFSKPDSCYEPTGKEWTEEELLDEIPKASHVRSLLLLATKFVAGGIKSVELV